MKNMRLREVFEEYRDRPFLFVNRGGNWGDHMIWLGAFRLAREVGLDFRDIGDYSIYTNAISRIFQKGKLGLINRGIRFVAKALFGLNVPTLDQDVEKRVLYKIKLRPNEIIYSQPTVYSWEYRENVKWFARLRRAAPKALIIHGPCSVGVRQRDYEYLGKNMPKDGNIIFFTRERISYEFMKQFYSRTYLDLDTSFHLEGTSDLKQFLEDVEPEDRYKTLIVREKREPAPLPCAIDVTAFDKVLDPTYMDKKTWLKTILHAKSLTSNRLHSIILSLLVGKKDLSIYWTSFHKTRSIWEYCLKQRGVKWVGPPGDL